MSTSQADGFPTLNGLRGPGRPSKRNKKVVAELLDAIASGAPFNLACQAAGLQPATFCDWRRRDPAFALEVDQAAARGTISRLNEIEAQGRGGAWQALSWLVERRHPADFAKPEVALNIGIQNNLNAQGGNGASFETQVLSDLEFLKLREHESYHHRVHEQPAREVPGEITVEPALSGSLVRADHPNGAVISQSQAEETQRRSERSRAKVEALLAARGQPGSTAQNGDGRPKEPELEPAEVSEGLVPGMITMPPGIITEGWWAQFCRSDSERLVEQRTAAWVCATLARETVMGQNARIEFEGDVSVGEGIAGLERIAGPGGW